jgi:hypothetical protein
MSATLQPNSAGQNVRCSGTCCSTFKTCQFWNLHHNIKGRRVSAPARQVSQGPSSPANCKSEAATNANNTVSRQVQHGQLVEPTCRACQPGAVIASHLAELQPSLHHARLKHAPCSGGCRVTFKTCQLLPCQWRFCWAWCGDGGSHERANYHHYSMPSSLNQQFAKLGLT